MSKSQKMSGQYRGYHQMQAFYAVVEKIRQAILASLLVHLEAVDPNWCRLTIEFDRSIYEKMHELAEHQRIEVGYKPLRALVNGPLKGDVDVTDKLGEEFVARELVGLLVASSVVHGSSLDARFWNKNHRIELIPERTQISFGNCEDGVVKSVTGSDFTVLRQRSHEIERLTLEDLRLCLASEDPYGDGPCDVEYYPLVQNGQLVESAKAAEEEGAELAHKRAERRAMQGQVKSEPEDDLFPDLEPAR